jgi:hypothetical protein
VSTCRGCDAEIEFVEIELKSGRHKMHPIDSPRRRVEEGRVTFDEDRGCYKILDARLKRESDGTLTVRAGRAWPVDGGAYASHFDTCPDVAARRMDEKRRAKPRNEQEEIDREIEEASSHIQRCRACGWPMDEALSADYAWRTHPSCDPAHDALGLDAAGLAERNRLTGRHDIRAADIVPSVSGEELAEIQHTVAEKLVKARLRRAQETVDIEWQQAAFERLLGEDEPA